MNERILVEKVILEITKNKFTEEQVRNFIQDLMYSIGISGLKKEFNTSEEVMAEYISNPNYYSALTAQSLIMRDKWNIKETKEV